MITTRFLWVTLPSFLECLREGKQTSPNFDVTMRNVFTVTENRFQFPITIINWWFSFICKGLGSNITEWFYILIILIIAMNVDIASLRFSFQTSSFDKAKKYWKDIEDLDPATRIIVCHGFTKAGGIYKVQYTWISVQILPVWENCV